MDLWQHVEGAANKGPVFQELTQHETNKENFKMANKKKNSFSSAMAMNPGKKIRAGLIKRGVILAFCHAAPVLSETDNTQKIHFNMPSRDLASALMDFAEQTGMELIYPASLTAGAKSRLLKGNYSAQEALGQLLRGTDVAYRAISETKKIVITLMDRYLAAKNKPVWCEKTPMNLDYLPLLDAHFPDARYICLYRHCQDVVHSSVNLSKFRFLPEHVPYVHRNPDNIIAAMTENWLEKTARLLAFEAAHAERCFRVRYEDVVPRPEETLAPLFRFLNVGWEAELMARVFEVGHDGGEGDGRAALSRRIRAPTFRASSWRKSTGCWANWITAARGTHAIPVAGVLFLSRE